MMTKEELEMDTKVKELLKNGEVEKVKEIQKDISNKKSYYFNRQNQSEYKLHKLLLGNINYQLQMYQEGNFKA